MIKKKTLFFSIIFLILTLCSACKKDSGLVFGEDNKTIEAFVLRRAEEGFYLVPEDDFEEGNGGDIFFAPFSKINSEYSDIQTGDFVEIFFDGYFEDIYPAEFHAIYRITETDEDYGRVSEATISKGLDKLSVLMAEDGYPVGENGMNQFLDNILENKGSSCAFYRYSDTFYPIYYYIEYKIEEVLGPRFHLTIDYSSDPNISRKNEEFDFEYIFFPNPGIAAFGECINSNIKNYYTLLDEDDFFYLLYSGLFTPTALQQEQILRIIEMYDREERKGIVKYNPSGTAKIELEPGDEELSCIIKTEKNIYDESRMFLENKEERFKGLKSFIGAYWYSDDICYLFGENDYSAEYPYSIFVFSLKEEYPVLQQNYQDYDLPEPGQNT